MEPWRGDTERPRKEFVYIVYDYHGKKAIGSFSSWTRDTPAKMREYLVKYGDIPYDAIVRREGENK